MKSLPFLQKRRTSNEKPKKNRMVVLHRRQITAVCLMLLIGVAGYLNWNFEQGSVDPEVTAVYNQVSAKIGEAQMVSGDALEETDETVNTAPQTNDYFSQARLERDIKRSESLDMLTRILNAQNTDKTARKEAEDEIARLSSYTEHEVMIENLIRAKGFSETLVFMGENLISIAVKSEGLNEIDAAVLRDAAISVTNAPAENIKIVEIQ